MAITGYRLGASLEPPHPHCTTSDLVVLGEARGGKLAVKILNLGFPLRDESRQRFVDAIRAVQRIDSPVPIRVADVGFCDNGQPFFAMEYVEGEPVAARIERKALASAAEVRTILTDVASGLSGARQVGLKPSIQARHIMITPNGARIWNLGIDDWREWARELVSNQYTAPGQYMRHASMTPHEAKGLPPTAANASAQLALIAFALMTGRPYWDADLDLDGPPMTMLMEVIANAPPPPSARTQVALPGGFDAWFARCLAGEVAEPSEAARTFPA